MKTVNCWYICGGLVATLFLLVASASGALRIPLALIVGVGLGIPAVLLLLENRAKLHDILGIGNRTIHRVS